MGKVVGRGSFRKVRLLFVFVLALLTVATSCEEPAPVERPTLDPDTIKVVENQRFGFDLKKFEVHLDTVRSGWTWGDILLPYNVDQYEINVAAGAAKDSTIGLKYILAGKPFTILTKKGDTSRSVQHMIYEPDVFSYITFDFTKDTVVIKKIDRPTSIQRKMVSGVIHPNSNLSVELGKSFDTYAMSAAIVDAIEGVYAWSIDFFKLQAGDRFVVYYDEKSVEGTAYAVEKISHAWFEHRDDGMYAFNFIDSTGEVSGFYDHKGRQMKRPFLMSPVKFARISSSFNMNRFHPIYKTRRPHLGTDYAAPTGTPIIATADGTVSRASRTRGNGIYVKLKHNKTYDTQYLHMSKIADGIRPGVRVKQGDVIGYVGSTGAATGPHVCYRFWKNGRQINHRSEKFPKSEPMKEEVLPEYLDYIEPLKEYLDKEIKTLKDYSPSEKNDKNS